MSRPNVIVLAMVAIVLLLLWICALAAGFPSIWWAVMWSLLVIAVAGAALAGMLFLRRRRAKALENALRAHGDAHANLVRPDLRPEVLEVRRDFEAAVRSLRISKLGASGRDALYRLPWYAIIGPPGAGKTTALQNSGLHFPQVAGARHRHRGFAGTRHCDWWLSNEAVLLDTAGRWSMSEDQEEWSEFLALLKQHRRRQPLNGILVAVPIAEIMEPGANGQGSVASQVRERIEEITNRLGFRLPVYVLFTKADLVTGFVEMFSDLGTEERSQIFGFTVPTSVGTDPVEAAFFEYFDELMASVEAQIPSRVASEPSLRRRELILEFPGQLRAYREAFGGFLAELFRENIYQHMPLFRGAYLTSGTQTGRPIDQLLARMGAAFQGERAVELPNSGMESRSYFLTDLFRTVIFQDQQLAMPSMRRLRGSRWRDLAAAACLSLAAFLLVSVTTFSGCGNLAMVRQADGFSKVAASDPEDFERLDNLKKLVVQLRAHASDGPPARLGFGMYQGADLYPAVRDLYLRRVLAAAVSETLDDTARELRRPQQLLQEDGRVSEESLRLFRRRYESLKGYLLLTDSTHEGPLVADAPGTKIVPRFDEVPFEEERSKTFLVEWLTQRLSEGVRHARKGQAAFTEHLPLFVAVLQELPAMERRQFLPSQDQSLVGAARRELSECPLEELVLAQIVSQFTEHDLQPRDVGVGRNGLHMKEEVVVRGAFTRSAWEGGVHQWLQDGTGLFDAERG